MPKAACRLRLHCVCRTTLLRNPTIYYLLYPDMGCAKREFEWSKPINIEPFIESARDPIGVEVDDWIRSQVQVVQFVDRICFWLDVVAKFQRN